MIRQPKCKVKLKKKKKRRPMIDVYLDGEEVQKLRNYVIQTYARRSGRSQAMVMADLKKRSFMTATEALTYGIVDSISEDWED